MNDEGLADATAANPFRLPRLHPDFRCSGCSSCTPVFRVADKWPSTVSSGSAMNE
jgi:hypothetical protein